MKRVFLLRANGDFIVAIQSIINSPIRKEFELIASLHLLPLYESLIGSIPMNDIAIRFEDWHIQESQLSLFTNRHLLNTKTIKEVLLVRSFLKKSIDSVSQDFLEQENRRKIFEVLTGKKFTAIAKQGNVYNSFHAFFKTTSTLITKEFLIKSKILILPSARIQRRDLPNDLVQTIQKKHLNKDDQITIAYFRKAMHEDAVSYSSFKELVDLIKASDFVYGADSLPIHLAYLLQKPHFILYPPNGSNLFFTPYVLENQFFSTFDSFK